MEVFDAETPQRRGLRHGGASIAFEKSEPQNIELRITNPTEQTQFGIRYSAFDIHYSSTFRLCAFAPLRETVRLSRNKPAAPGGRRYSLAALASAASDAMRSASAAASASVRASAVMRSTGSVFERRA